LTKFIVNALIEVR